MEYLKISLIDDMYDNGRIIEDRCNRHIMLCYVWQSMV
jgi:hypothetical protein